MREFTHAQIIEFFHVAFLDVLSRRLDVRRYVLKGGVNLRYFYGSPRYSEDIDLDLKGAPPWSLEKKVDGVLDSGAMKLILRAGSMAIAEYSKPKQTETTRRWKVALGVSGRSQAVRTKIEFSNRKSEERFALEPVPRRVVEPYALRPPMVQHYTEDVPTEQKVRALAGRSETQARDVFDLDLLLRQRRLPDGSLDSHIRGEAADRAMQLPFAAFRDQVLPFLEPDAVELYDSEAAWEQMQTFVAETLEASR